MDPPSTDPAATERPLVLGVIGQDAHIIGLRLLEIAFVERGYEVVNLGVMVSQEEFIQAAIETDAAAILVSSLYGHGELDCEGLRAKCDEAGLSKIRLFVGGNLVIGKQSWQETEEKFLSMGFDRAYPPGMTPSEAVDAVTDVLRELGDTRDTTSRAS